jgi:Flp pilus assembly protein TadG
MWGQLRRLETKRLPLKRLKALARDTRAATIIEFALVAAPFVALIFATVQTSMVFFAQQALETTAEKTERQLVTGSAQQSGMTQQQFDATACANLPSFMKCQHLLIDVQTADSFADVDTTGPTLTYDKNGNVSNNWQFNPGTAGSIVVMRTMYLFPVISAPLGFNLANAGNGRRLLVATSVFKTEPYAS